MTGKPLAGRVAIVTGASRGIGNPRDGRCERDSIGTDGNFAGGANPGRGSGIFVSGI